MDCTIYVVKTKALISCLVTAQLICALKLSHIHVCVKQGFLIISNNPYREYIKVYFIHVLGFLPKDHSVPKQTEQAICTPFTQLLQTRVCFTNARINNNKI